VAPGDHAVVVWPGYQSLHEVARAAGAEVTLLPLAHESGWRLDLDALEAALRPRTRVIVVNFPHSPTGAHLNEASFERVLALARERGILVFSDEVYRYAEYRDEDRLPAAVERYEAGFSLGVMSKAFGLAGLRIGWIAARDREMLGRLMSFKHYLTICNSAPAWPRSRSAPGPRSSSGTDASPSTTSPASTGSSTIGRAPSSGFGPAPGAWPSPASARRSRSSSSRPS